MVITELKPEEFPILAGISDGYVPDPKMSAAFVAKDGQDIVGRIFLLQPVHVEGPWIEPWHRGGLLAVQLVEAAVKKAQTAGISRLFAYATDHTIADYLGRLGFKIEPWTVWVKEI